MKELTALRIKMCTDLLVFGAGITALIYISYTYGWDLSVALFVLLWMNNKSQQK